MGPFRGRRALKSELFSGWLPHRQWAREPYAAGMMMYMYPVRSTVPKVQGLAVSMISADHLLLTLSFSCRVLVLFILASFYFQSYCVTSEPACTALLYIGRARMIGRLGLPDAP